MSLPSYCQHVEQALLAFRNQELTVSSKSTLRGNGLYAVTCHAAWWTRERFFFHNLYGADVPSSANAAHYRSTQLLVSSLSLELELQLVGSMVSKMVPVAVTLVAAKRLACKDSKVLGLIGSGLQARLHMAALRTQFQLSEILIYTRSAESFNFLSEEAQRLGLDCKRVGTPREAVSRSDIVVTSISDSLGISPFLQVSWLKPRAFLSSVDLFRPWENTVRAARFLVADDPEGLTKQIADGRVPDCGLVDASLADVLACAPELGDEPRILVHPGCSATLFGTAEAIRAAILSRSAVLSSSKKPIRIA